MRNPTRVPENQQGVALVMAMVILLILTLLGVSAMKSSSLELKMAAGLQDNAMAFQAAESGLIKAFSNLVLDPNQSTPSNFTPVPGVWADTVTTFTEYSLVQDSDQPSSKVSYRHANFTQKVTAQTAGGAKVVLHQGVRQLVNK